MNLKDLAKKAIENSDSLTDATNQAKKRTAVAFINKELIDGGEYTAETLPIQEIDETIEEVLDDSK
ncbi:hypothetical protein [Pseudolactococcus reticulitermitis]|uniref:Uncharacterized protein n=1 Tax=Pseudolactococcus reticulitermitis TaxID=2025039 RepID=A0A224XCC6_9LACT|nr:hypothetical protein [Lactococcus reticulitermitis]GAX47325.1 hypothetical protein RsY01_924 [Lactococcus reticulitermitis]